MTQEEQIEMAVQKARVKIETEITCALYDFALALIRIQKEEKTEESKNEK